MRKEPWNPDRRLPWDLIKREWDRIWDQSKPVLLEKSPPNLCRAPDIQDVFVPSYFIAMIQNPYAHCQGLLRRDSKLGEGAEGAAQFWVKCAQYQKRNIECLNRIVHFTYEAFTENPGLLSKKILDFIPELKQLDINQSFQIRSVLGPTSNKIVNLSQVKINLLSAKDIAAISSVLKEYPDLMDFFGYEYMEPTLGHTIRRYRALISVNTRQAVQRVKNLRKRIINGVRASLKNSDR
jgi:hypothetical protein